MKIKMFADGADLKSIAQLNEDDRVSGFTTNPSLMKKAGISDYSVFCRDAASLVGPKPISFEVFADSLNEMHSQAKQIADFGSNVYVKIPIMNTQGLSTLGLCKDLSEDGVQLNVTAIFTDVQVESTIEALKNGAPSVVSVFAGRIADAGVDPEIPMAKYAKQTSAFSQIELLWASTREVYNVVQANRAGCDIITMTPDLFGKLGNIGKDLHQFSLETVQMFYDDATSSGFKF